jgi:hypothetical protein
VTKHDREAWTWGDSEIWSIYKGYPESKDTGPIKVQGTYFFFSPMNGSAAMLDRNCITGQSLLATVTVSLCSQYVFKMVVSIQNPAKCEVCAVVRFLHAQGETAAEIHYQLASVYSEYVMNRQNVAKSCCEFEVGRSDVHDEIRSGRPLLSLMKSCKKLKTVMLTDV